MDFALLRCKWDANLVGCRIDCVQRIVTFVVLAELSVKKSSK